MSDAILYVEDSAITSEEARAFLARAFPGYRILQAYDAETALRLAQQNLGRLAVVCTDGELLQGHGLQLARDLEGIGFSGPKIYTGTKGIPDEDKHLFDGIAPKSGSGLVDAIRKGLSKRPSRQIQLV